MKYQITVYERYSRPSQLETKMKEVVEGDKQELLKLFREKYRGHKVTARKV